MDTIFESIDRIAEIEARQNDALAQLEELERRLDKLLAEYAPRAEKDAAPAVLDPRAAGLHGS